MADSANITIGIELESRTWVLDLNFYIRPWPIIKFKIKVITIENI